ncbi:hypothetical protein SVIO_066040 [Streptomyces violaceusniger]|uniref:N-acetyltransferase domain-containing protein n=1 Tax=Streptomyces violaceusniger TaxID=68280 RepID=A0A4D4L2Z4_STRVO|nr:hypothetical protein SVIO_066040 [Streptomyces violaceusniger]
MRMVLETGTEQPEAIALYTSSGYTPVTKFGLYRFEETSRCYAKLLTDATGAADATDATGLTGLTGRP